MVSPKLTESHTKWSIYLIKYKFNIAVIVIMLTIHSPKFSASGRAEFMSNKMSPSFRNKRIPSALDNYSCENNNVKLSKNESPSKLS